MSCGVKVLKALFDKHRRKLGSPDHLSLLQLVAQRGHRSLHALVLLPLTLEDGGLGLNLLDYLIQHSTHSPGLLLLHLKLCLTFCICIVQLNTGEVEGKSILAPRNKVRQIGTILHTVYAPKTKKEK